MPALLEINDFSIDEIQKFRKTGKSLVISDRLKKYILHLDKSIEIFNYEGNISRAAVLLIDEFPEDNLTFRTAQNRIYDAINYFHLNNTVKNEAWNNYYADKLENLAKLALGSWNITEARRCYEKARTFRTDKDENLIDPDELNARDFIINPDINLDRLGLPNVNLKTLWTETVDFIEILDIDKKDKERLMSDAQLAINANNGTENNQ